MHTSGSFDRLSYQPVGSATNLISYVLILAITDISQQT